MYFQVHKTNGRMFKHISYYWAPPILYCLLIFFQSSYPSLEQTPDFPHMDKLLHGGAYALLGFLFYRALRAGRLAGRIFVLFFLSSVLATLYGVSDEIHQHFVLSRNADILDVAADAVGSVIGAWSAHAFFAETAVKKSGFK